MKITKSDIKLKRKPAVVILIITLLFTYMLPFAMSGQAGSASANAEFAFNGIGKGLDPKGNHFDVNEIKKEMILKKAITKSGMEKKITTSELRKKISVKPVVHSYALEDLISRSAAQENTKEVKERAMYPNTYIIECKDRGILSYFATKKLLENILLEYEGYMKDKYLEDTDIPSAFSKEEILAMDYPEMTKVLQQSAEGVERYASNYVKWSPQFVSEKTGVSFSDLLEQSTTVRIKDINDMGRMVNYYVLTRDSQSRIKYEETVLKRAKLLAKKRAGQESTVKQMMDVYDNESNVVFASGDAGNFQLGVEENKFYNDLIQEFAESNEGVISAKYAQSDILRILEKLNEGSDLSPEEYREQGEGIEKQAELILVKLSDIKENVTNLAEENFEKNIASKISIGKVHYNWNTAGNLLVNYLIFLMIYVFTKVLYNNDKIRKFYFNITNWVKSKRYLMKM